MSIAVVNQHTNNYGDDAAGVALVHELLETLGPQHVEVFYIWHGEPSPGLPVGSPQCRHHFLDDLSGRSDQRPRLALLAVARVLGRRVTRPDLAALLRACRDAEVVLVSPAGSNIGIYKDWMYLLVLLHLVLEGVRPVFVQNTIGPSRSVAFDVVARYVLRRSWLSVRESGSQRWLARHRMSAYLGVDTALADRRPALPRPGLPGLPATGAYLAVVPTRLGTWHRDYKGRDESLLWADGLVAGLASAARTHGLDLVIVPHLHGPQAEPATVADVAARLEGAGARVHVAPVRGLDDYRAWLAGAHVAVSMRYHGLVLAAQHGVPCVALAYERKMHEAAAYLGLAHLALDVASFDAEQLAARIADALGERDALHQRLLEAVPELREIARGPILSARAGALRARR